MELGDFPRFQGKDKKGAHTKLNITEIITTKLIKVYLSSDKPYHHKIDQTTNKIKTTLIKLHNLSSQNLSNYKTYQSNNLSNYKNHRHKAYQNTKFFF